MRCFGEPHPGDSHPLGKKKSPARRQPGTPALCWCWRGSPGPKSHKDRLALPVFSLLASPRFKESYYRGGPVRTQHQVVDGQPGLNFDLPPA
jgi:hypothetical protein